MSGVFESWNSGERQPHPAETANRWVNQQGPVLLEHEYGSLRPVHELLGEWQAKSLFFLTPHPDHYGLTTLAGAVPDIVSRWQTRDSQYGKVTGVDTFKTLAWLREGLRVLRSGSSFPAPGDQWLRLGSEDFLASFGLSSREADAWIERNGRGHRLSTIDPYRQRSDEYSSERRSFGGAELLSVGYLKDLEEQERRRGKGMVVLATFSGAIVVAAGACAPVQEVPNATQTPAPTRAPTATFTPEPPTPTPLAGGPDDERVVNIVSPWPSLVDIPAVRTDGGPFTFDAEANNVRAQLTAVNGFLRSAGWMIVSSPEQLTTGKTVHVAPFQDGQQWSIQALTSDGLMFPIRNNGAVMDRPDWATRDVTQYQELEHGLGPDYSARFELVNDHWVAVVRSDEGERAGYFDIFEGSWVFDAQAVAEELVETLEDHPNDTATWPAEYRSYFENPSRYAGQYIETQTDAFVTESRRGLLQYLARQDPTFFGSIMTHMRTDGLLRTGGSGGADTIERMSAKELLWATLIHNAEIQEKTIFTPNEIRGIMGDSDSLVVNWTENRNGNYIQHGRWFRFFGQAGSLDQDLMNFNYEMDVFGKTVTIPGYPSITYMGGLLAGMVELPENAGTGMLVTYKDQDAGNWHLQIFHVVDRTEAIQFDESMELCVGHVNSYPYRLKMVCPEITLYSDVRVGDSSRSERLREGFSPDWLSWPGHQVMMIMYPVQYYYDTYRTDAGDRVQADVEAFHHPVSGIEIARRPTMTRP